MFPIVRYFTAIAALLALAGCSTSTTTSADDPAIAKYKQTWTKNYGQTSCSELHSVMTAHQRWAAAADMLSAARHADSGTTDMPEDSLVTKFLGQVDAYCDSGDYASVADAGGNVYGNERAKFQPAP